MTLFIAPTQLITAFYTHMIPHRLAVLGVFASAIHPQFEGIARDPQALDVLHTLLCDTRRDFIALGVEVLRMGMYEVLGVVDRRVEGAFALECSPELACLVNSDLSRRVLRACFCRTVLDFQDRILRREPECLSATVRILIHGGFVRSLRALAKDDAMATCRRAFTFTGFTLHQLFMRSDPAVTGLSLPSEQVEWSLLSDAAPPQQHAQRLRARLPPLRSQARLRRLVDVKASQHNGDDGESMNLAAISVLLKHEEEALEAAAEQETPPFYLVLVSALAEARSPLPQ